MQLLVLSWSVRPSSKAMAAISHEIYKSSPRRVTIVGEKEFASTKWPGIYYIRTNLFKSFRGYQYIRWLFYIFNVGYISYLVRRKNIDSMLVYFPNEYHASLALGVKLLTGINLFVWFHNLYEENMSGYRLHMAKILEPAIIQNSDRIYAISEAVAHHLRSKYRGTKIDVLLHPMSDLQRFKSPWQNILKDKIIISYTGSLHESCRDSTVRMLTFLKGKENLYELRVFGGRGEKDFNALKMHLPENIRFEGFVEDDRFAEALWECHVHFVPHGLTSSKLSNSELMTIFPTRIIPVLATGAPVFLLAPKDSYVYHWIEDNECGFLLDTELTNFETLLSQAVGTDYCSRSDNALNAVKRFEIENFWYTLDHE